MKLNQCSLNAVSLNTVYLNGVGTPSSRSDKPSLDPALKAKLVAVWNPRGKTNEDADRAVIRDLTGHGNDLEIKNASYIEGSGYKDGAFVTDGVEDMIVSKKPVSEMLEGSNEFTVISIISQISSSSYTNYIGYKNNTVSRITTNGLGKTGIYGYSINNDSSGNIINILVLLGDKLDYTSYGGSGSGVNYNNYSVVGTIDSGAPKLLSSVAYYGGFICKGVLTKDQINQIIAYYNLDWWIEPDGWYDVAKQGITNENHATFNDKLIDYSGNGRDLQCNNFGWALNSGVGKWGIDFNDMVKSSSTQLKGYKIEYTVSNDRFYPLYFRPTYNVDVSSFVVNCDFDGTLYYYYINDKGIRTQYILNKGINVLPKSIMSLNPGTYNCGFYAFGGATFGVIEQLPEVEGGLWHDGVEDNCTSVINFPAYKDFTVVVDRCLEDSPANGAVISKDATTGEFIFDSQNMSYASFGASVRNYVPKGVRKTSYLTKYGSLEVSAINPGNTIGKEFHIATGTFRRGDTRFSAFGLYGFLVYPYSMNEFLIERQLKKRKFGTLYPKT